MVMMDKDDDDGDDDDIYIIKLTFCTGPSVVSVQLMWSYCTLNAI